jgi:hypothetical protein
MTDKEALKRALEVLKAAYVPADLDEQRENAITAIKQALALDKKAENARELGLDYEPVQEPFEYWTAVEGWVKIDEVREHFDSVGCGTIYKTAGDGRVPLTAAQPAVPDAIIEAGESPDYRDGWNDCRAETLKMRKS